MLVVVNHGDAPGIDELAREVRVASPETPQGYGANLNLGMRLLEAPEFVLLANDDVVFAPESLPLLLRALRDDLRAGIAGPRLVDRDGKDATSFASFPTVRDAIREVAILPGPLWRLAQRRRPEPPRPDFVLGAAMLVRRAAFDAVGGFDEDFFLNFEETDFCFRLREAGWGVAWVPDAVVTHLQGSSISRDLNFATFYASLCLYHRKRLGAVRWTLVEALLVALFAAGAIYSALGALLRPRSARRRLDEVRQRWRTRLFLQQRPPRP